MVNQLWSRTQQDPALAAVFVIVAIAFIIVIAVSVQVGREARRSRLVTAAELRRDQQRMIRMRQLREQQQPVGRRRDW